MASTGLEPSNRSASLVSASLWGSSGTPSTIGNFRVSYSGQSILYTPENAQGDPLNLTALRNSNDVQILALTGVAQATALTLQFGGQSTASIPLVPQPPLTSFLWHTTLPQSGSYDLGLSWGYFGPPPTGQPCPQALLEVFDGGTLIGSVWLDQSKYPDDSVDIKEPGIGVFKSFGTFGFATNQLAVRMSGVAGPHPLLAGTLRLAPHGATDPTQTGFIDPSPNRALQSDGAVEGLAGNDIYGNWTLTFFTTPVGHWHGVYYATPTGTSPTAFPKLVDVQAALAALPNVPSNSLAITAPTNQSLRIEFTGSLGGQACASLVSSEAAISVIHDDTQGSSVGGQYPSVVVNGQNYPLRAASFALNKPFAMFHLVQDAPDLQYLRFNEGLCQTGYYDVRLNQGFGGRVGIPSQPGTVGIYKFQGLAGPADYSVAITWPQGDAQAGTMKCLIQDGSGATLATVAAIDQTQKPTDFQEGGVAWKTLARVTLPVLVNSLNVVIVCDGTANKHLLLDTVRLARVSPRQSVQIQPTDQVLFNAPAGFISTNTGPMPGADHLIVNPALPTRLPPLPTQTKVMKVGTNCSPPNYYGVDSFFTNLAVQANTPLGLAQTASGNPTQLAYDGRFGGGSAATQLCQAPSDYGGKGLGVPNYPPGIWTIQWQGSAWNYCALLPNNTTTTVVEDVSRRVSGAINRRYYQINDPSGYSPGVALGFFSTRANGDGTYACDVANVAVYPPDVDPTQTSLWRPSFIQKIKGLHCFRFMDFFGTNNLNLAKFEHFPDSANFPLGYAGRSIKVPIATIGPPEPDLFAENMNGTVVKVTTKIPHGLTTGFRVQLRTTDGSSLGQVIGNIIDPKTNATTTATRDPIDPTDGYNGQSRIYFCHVLDATTLQIGINVYSGPPARMANTLTPQNAIVYADIAPGAMVSPSDAANLCAEAGVEPWINVPVLADDDCVLRLAEAFAKQLPPNTLVHVEYGNEVWNYSFYAYYYCVWLGNLNGTPGREYIPTYIKRMSEVHQIFREVWAAVGRDPSEIRRVCGVQADAVGETTIKAIQYAISQGITFDEIAPASYFNNASAVGPNDDVLTREQLLDLFASNMINSDMPILMSQHLQACASLLAQNPGQTWLAQVELVNYEGGPDTMTTITMSANIARMNHAVHRDPDFYELMLFHLQTLENVGVKLFNIFTLYGTGGSNQWGMYEGSHMVAGTGNAQLDVANRNDYENLPLIKSETAAALQKWVTLRMPPVPTWPALRNEMIKTFGRRHF